jgi:hypothetical protein
MRSSPERVLSNGAIGALKQLILENSPAAPTAAVSFYTCRRMIPNIWRLWSRFCLLTAQNPHSPDNALILSTRAAIQIHALAYNLGNFLRTF